MRTRVDLEVDHDPPPPADDAVRQLAMDASATPGEPEIHPGPPSPDAIREWAAAQPDAPESQGYRKTKHVKQYYDLVKF